MNSYLPKSVTELVELLQLIPHPEGGFFIETFRSGSIPMSSRGQTNYSVDSVRDLVVTHQRDEHRPDHNVQRNCLTSIFWVPTNKSPMLPLTINQSDHVHYYQGGRPFQYILYNPNNPHPDTAIQTIILGPDIIHGNHQLQVPVPGGWWKCGRLLVGIQEEEDKASASTTSLNNAVILPDITNDYALIAEAVGPGFDYHDFQYVSEQLFHTMIADSNQQEILKPYLHHQEETISTISESKLLQDEKNKAQEFDGHYDPGQLQIERIQERM